MQVGNFTREEYLNYLYEKAKQNKQSGGPAGDPGEGIIIPPENRRAYDWLKGEYDKNKHEVKVEITSAKFEPGYSTEGAKDFKPGVYTTSKTSQGYNQEKLDKSNEPQEAHQGKQGNIKIKLNKK